MKMADVKECLCCAIIANIPHEYHSADLRNYFSQFIESGGFDCFHFRHRPETKCSTIQDETVDSIRKPGETCILKPKPTAKTGTSDTGSVKEKKTTCCVIRLSEFKLLELIKMYHKRHWLDSKGDSMPSLCIISKIQVTANPGHEPSCIQYQTRKERKTIPVNRETFTEKDLASLPELRPPELMKNGNVGTPTKIFLQLIQECRLPSFLIRKLGLTFPKTRSNRRYGNVPFEYWDGKVPEGDVELEEAIEVKDAQGHEIEEENEVVKSGKKKSKKKISEVQVNAENNRNSGVESEEDADECEEWERHEALHDDPANVERNKERLFEEKIELKWEKGGSGLVFYTDAQFWDKQEGDFDEKTTDDWDVDMGIYYEPNGGDKDARDFADMRLAERRRNGMDVEEDNIFNGGIGKFEKHTKGIGRRVLTKQGWKDGQGLGTTTKGMADALDNDGQLPFDKSGFGFRGEKLMSYASRRPASSKTKLRNLDPDRVIISTVYDNPEETDPQEPLMRRFEPYHLKHRQSGYKHFTKAQTSKDKT